MAAGRSASGHDCPVTGLQAVLFDMDGTLVETESLWHESEIRTMAQFGYEWTEADRALSVGGPIDRVIEYMSGLCGADSVDILRVICTEIEHLMATRPLVMQPGARELHTALIDAGFPVALASNSWRTLMELVLTSTALSFDASIAGDEVKATKPDPFPYLRLAQILQVDPAACVVIEDSPTGVTAGQRAGAAIVAVPDVSRSLEPASGRLVVDSLEAVTVATLCELVEAHQLALL